MSQEVLTVSVSQLNDYIKRVLENNTYLKNIWVKGEISNYKMHYSGHAYLTLKDEGSLIKAVMFKGTAKTLRFEPENGMKVLARGRVSVYPRDGQYQLYVEEMQPDGVGALHIAYEQLKARLLEEGLFHEKYKKPLPKFPQRIGVVTAATGAAVRDIIHVLGRRYPIARINIFPVAVQGVQAAPQIAEAIALFNEKKMADVLIVGRGGGSIEDLWAFNEEVVARAIFASEIPVVSAVGHETDFTIADFAADMRAPTPSAAAEIVVPSILEIKERLGVNNTRLLHGIQKKMEQQYKKLERLQNAAAFSHFLNKLQDKRLYIDAMQKTMEKDMTAFILLHREKLVGLIGKLDVLSPLKVLGRGYSLALNQEGDIIKSKKQVKKGDDINLKLYEGEISCRVL